MKMSPATVFERTVLEWMMFEYSTHPGQPARKVAATNGRGAFPSIAVPTTAFPSIAVPDTLLLDMPFLCDTADLFAALEFPAN